MNESNDEQNGLSCAVGTPRDRRNKSRIIWGSLIWAGLLIGSTFVVARTELGSRLLFSRFPAFLHEEWNRMPEVVSLAGLVLP
jgi:hypothetical protein